MTDYKIIKKQDHKEIIFKQTPEKYAVIVESKEKGERIILPSETNPEVTYYVEDKKNNNQLKIGNQDTVKKVLTN